MDCAKAAFAFLFAAAALSLLPRHLGRAAHDHGCRFRL
jgi:hypothetical protein